MLTLIQIFFPILKDRPTTSAGLCWSPLWPGALGGPTVGLWGHSRRHPEALRHPRLWRRCASCDLGGWVGSQRSLGANPPWTHRSVFCRFLWGICLVRAAHLKCIESYWTCGCLNLLCLWTIFCSCLRTFLRSQFQLQPFFTFLNPFDFPTGMTTSTIDSRNVDDNTDRLRVTICSGLEKVTNPGCRTWSLVKCQVL